MDRAFFYAVIVGGMYALCILVLLNNSLIAFCSGVLVGCLALVRGVAMWG